ncbi:hypothetical protein GCM10010837_50890 [Aminobacter niigataensis]
MPIQLTNAEEQRAKRDQPSQPAPTKPDACRNDRDDEMQDGTCHLYRPVLSEQSSSHIRRHHCGGEQAHDKSR